MTLATAVLIGDEYGVWPQNRLCSLLAAADEMEHTLIEQDHRGGLDHANIGVPFINQDLAPNAIAFQLGISIVPSDFDSGFTGWAYRQHDC